MSFLILMDAVAVRPLYMRLGKLHAAAQDPGTADENLWTKWSLSRNVRHPLTTCNVRYQAFFIKM